MSRQNKLRFPIFSGIIILFVYCGFLFHGHFLSANNTLVNGLSRKLVSFDVPFTDFSNSENLSGTAFYNSTRFTNLCPQELLTRVGKAKGDGGKWVCGLTTLGKLSDQGHNCIVYSFGVSGDSSFEAEVLQNTNCAIFAYDFSVNHIGRPLKENNPRVHFQKMGIAGNNTDKLKTLKTFMTQNGHTFADILKMDVEGWEYASLERMFQDYDELPFGQLLLEVHVKAGKGKKTWTPLQRAKVTDLILNLEKRGARVFSVEPNVKAPVCCSEYSFINLNYLDMFIPI